MSKTREYLVVAITTRDVERTGLWLFSLNDFRYQQLLADDPNNLWFTLSPDGSRLAYNLNEFEIILADLEPIDLRQP